MSESQTPPATTPDNDNSVIRGLREQHKALNDQLKAKEAEAAELATKLQDIERAKLDQLEQLRLQLQDKETELATVKALADRLPSLESNMEAIYNRKIEALPEEHRERIKRLSSAGDWAHRLEAIDDALSLLPAAVARAGVLPKEATPPAKGTKEQRTPEQIKAAGWEFKPLLSLTPKPPVGTTE
jgi:chromosome segregation ATPase